MIKKLLLAAPLALAAGSLFATPASAHDWGSRTVRHTEVVRVNTGDSHRDWRDGQRDRKERYSHERRHQAHERHERVRFERHDRR